MCLINGYAGIVIFYLASIVRNQDAIYKSIFILAAFQFLWLFSQIFNVDPVFQRIGNLELSDTVGFVGSHNQLGLYYASVAPLLFSMNPFLVVASFFAICVSKCSSAMIGAIVGVLTYYGFSKSISNWKFFKWVLIGLFVGLVIFVKMDFSSEVFFERMAVTKLTIKQAIQGRAYERIEQGVNKVVNWNPLFGCGLGSFMTVSPLTQGEVIWTGYRHRYEHAHNDFIEAFFEFGWLGIIIILWAIADVLMKFKMNFKKINVLMPFSCVLAQAFSSLGIYSIHAPVSLFMFCLMLGLFYGACKGSSNGDQCIILEK